MKIELPRAMGHHGGIELRFYPGGVKCLITYPDVAGFNTVEGWASADEEEIECYNHELLAVRSYLKAFEQIPSEEELIAQYDAHYEKLQRQTKKRRSWQGFLHLLFLGKRQPDWVIPLSEAIKEEEDDG